MRKNPAQHGSILKDESGLSLINLLVIVAMIITATMIITKSQVNSMRTTRSVRATSAYEDTFQSFQTALILSLRNFFTAPTSMGCPSQTLFNNVPISDDTSFYFRHEIASAANDPAQMVAAKQQCLPPVFQDGRFHFCVAINRGPTAGSSVDRHSSLTAMNEVFAHLNIQLWNTHQGVEATCSEYIANPDSHIIIVEYDIHWTYQQKSSGALMYKNKQGVFYATN